MNLPLLALALSQLLAPVQDVQDAAEPPGRHALLVGCSEYRVIWDRYKEDKNLEGPAHDVELMRTCLIQQLDFEEESITTLVGWPDEASKRPTRDNIRRELNALAERVRDGDRVVVLFAGHGSQQPDQPGGDELDGLDEIFLPADAGRWDKKDAEVENSLSDDELNVLLSAIRDKGARVWAIFDCCHSGTLLRSGSSGIRFRHLDPERDLGVPEDRMALAAAAKRAAPQGSTPGVVKTSKLDGMVAFYGAESYHQAPEMKLPKGEADSDMHGLLTYSIVQEVTKTRGQLSFRDLHSRLLSAYQAIPFYGTAPVAEGELTLKVNDNAVDSSPMLRLKPMAGGRRLKLNAGSMTGIHVGSILELFDPRDEAKASLGRAEVVRTSLTEADCKRLPSESSETSEGDLPDICYGEIVESPMPEFTLRVAVVNGSRRTLRSMPPAIERIVKGLAFVRLVEDPEAAEWLVLVEGAQIDLEPVASGSATTLFRSGEARLKEDLQNIFKVQNLRRIATGHSSRLPDGLDVRLLRREGESEDSFVPVPPGQVLHPGDVICFEIQNRTGEAYDLSLLWLDAEYGVHVVWPESLWRSRLTKVAALPKRTETWTITDEPLGFESLLAVAVPRTEQQEKIDLSWLAQKSLPTTRSNKSDLEVLFQAGAFGGSTLRGRRGIRRKGKEHMNLSTWSIAWPQQEEVAGGFSGPPTVGGLVLTRENLSSVHARPATAQRPSDGREVLRGGSLVELYPRLAPSVVLVSGLDGHGTGFFIGDRGLVLTNYHVVGSGYSYSEGGRHQVNVWTGAIDENGSMVMHEDPLAAEVVQADRGLDLALLRILDLDSLPPEIQALELAPEEAGPPHGADVFLIGHPASGMTWSARPGIVARVGLWTKDMIGYLSSQLIAGSLADVGPQLAGIPTFKILLSTCGGMPGDSGSPLFDEEGRVVAVAFAIPPKEHEDKFVYHIHRDVVAEFLALWSEEGALEPEVPDPWLLGPIVSLYQTPRSGSQDVLVAGNGGQPEQILIDMDEEPALEVPDSAALESLVRKRSFDAEVAVHYGEDGRRTAFYDQDNDGAFDLVLIDFDADPEADVRFSLDAEGHWVFEQDLDIPWMNTSYLEYLSDDEETQQAIRKLKYSLNR